jgi:Icc-related predicted phosphoesterase
MLRIAWCTDLHLNFQKGNKAFFDKILRVKPDALFISGDIAEASDVSPFVADMEAKFDIPIYFVLGNHDYYHGSLKQVRSEMEALNEGVDNIHWLPGAGVKELAPGVCVVGVDGWYDGRYGMVDPPKVVINDWRIIEELRPFYSNQQLLLSELRELADAEAALARVYLEEASGKYHTVYFITHVPPWVEAAWHQYNFSEEGWAPWFTSKALGDALEEVAHEYTLTNFEVLCGHTHSSGELHVLPNLRCRTGAAVYGKPDIVDMICIKNT